MLIFYTDHTVMLLANIAGKPRSKAEIRFLEFSQQERRQSWKTFIFVSIKIRKILLMHSLCVIIN